ncbi:hypothetical protein [Capnocytophaga gingivalis]
MTKYLYLFLIASFFSCQQRVTFDKDNNTTILNTEEAPNRHTQRIIKNTEKEEKINDTELSSFLKELQVCLSQGQVTKIADTMVHYPLNDEGPLYEMLYGDIVYRDDFTTEDKPIVREDFIKIYHKLFPKRYIALFERLNIEKIAKEKKFEWWNKEKTTLIDFSFLTEDSFQISISFMEEDVVGGYSIKYLFKKINRNILLYLVRSI